MTQFSDFGVAGSQSATTRAAQTLIASPVPPLGNVRYVDAPAAIAANSLIRADGALAASTDAAVGVVRDEVTAAEIAAGVTAGVTPKIAYYTSGHFVFEALVVAPSITTAAIAQTACDLTAANTTRTLKITSNKYAGV